MMDSTEFEKFVADAEVSFGSLPDGVIARIVRLELARTCLSCGAKEAADGSLPCNH
ncbi:hypothetical protein NDN94_07590 [Burkholderia glumae]|uniref:hypothetical protein n=1 Tax=Burkholderia glumae TaxID=337 RepID=UPI0020368606|nr:hypothetical protein [Burkholderia glumae]MCM2537689.1 hypothetical protein [Burkholderia glumae]